MTQIWICVPTIRISRRRWCKIQFLRSMMLFGSVYNSSIRRRTVKKERLVSWRTWSIIMTNIWKIWWSDIGPYPHDRNARCGKMKLKRNALPRKTWPYKKPLRRVILTKMETPWFRKTSSQYPFGTRVSIRPHFPLKIPLVWVCCFDQTFIPITYLWKRGL